MPTYKKGDYVRVTSLFTIDSYLGLEVDDILCIEGDSPDEGGVIFIPGTHMAYSTTESEGCYLLTYNQVEPVNGLVGEMFRKN